MKSFFKLFFLIAVAALVLSLQTAEALNTEDREESFDWDKAIDRINNNKKSEYNIYNFIGLKKSNGRDIQFTIGVNHRSPLYVEEYRKGQDEADKYAEFNFFVGPEIVNKLKYKILIKTSLPYNIHNRSLDTGRVYDSRNRDEYVVESGDTKTGRKNGVYWGGRSRVGADLLLHYDHRPNQRTWKSTGLNREEDLKNYGEFIFEGTTEVMPIIKYWTADTVLPVYNELLSIYPNLKFQIQFHVQGFDVGARYIGHTPVTSDIVSLRKRIDNGHYFVVNIAKPIIQGGKKGEIKGDLPWDIYENTYCNIVFKIEDESGVLIENTVNQ